MLQLLLSTSCIVSAVVCYASSLSCVQFFVTLSTVARQVPLSMGILQARILEWVAMPFQGIFPTRGSSQPRSLSLQVDSLPSEPPGKPKNTGMSSLSLLQGIFLTQELNWGILHCRQILYQLSQWYFCANQLKEICEFSSLGLANQIQCVLSEDLSVF